MLASLNDVMPALDRKRVCVPAFDVGGGQIDFLLGLLGACEAARCPAVLLIYAGTATYYGSFELAVAMVDFYASRSSVPVVLHLDHASDEQTVEDALRFGMKSIMFDASSRPLDENIARTAAMVELCHGHGAAIEGELGRFGQEHGTGGDGAALTDPDEAAHFVRETGVDCLAPAVGNAHGLYKQPPKLRFELIEKLAASAGVPLSLHGGTGIPMADVREAGQLGMRKMNIATGIHIDFTTAIQAVPHQDQTRQNTWREIFGAGRQAVADTAAGYIRDMNCQGLLE